MRVVPYGLTDAGLARPANEDRYLVRAARGLSLLAVADGIGGHQAGEVAAEIALARFADAVASRLRAGSSPEAAVEGGVAEANEAVQSAADRPDREGMGTTLTAVLVDRGAAVIGHVGDSRAYLVRGGRARLLTRDDSVVAELMRHGGMTEAQAAEHAARGVLTQAIGGPAVAPQLLTITLLPDDRLVLCTDGLSNLVEDREIAALAGSHPADRAAQRLVALATDRGAPDNVTVIVAEMVRSRRALPAAALVAALLGLAGAGVGYAAAQRTVFLGIEGGRVAVYRGVPVEVFGVRLYRLEEATGVERASLPPLYRQRLDERIIVRDLQEARTVIEDLRREPGP